MRLFRVNKALRLNHVHLFSLISMEKGIGDIKLSYRPSLEVSKCENNTNGDWFHHYTKCLAIVNVNLLMKFRSSKLGFIVF